MASPSPPSLNDARAVLSGRICPSFLCGRLLVTRSPKRTMKNPPTERERAIAQQRANGRTFQRIGREFGLTPESVRDICGRVEDFDRGSAMLHENPASIDALTLIGWIRPSVRQALQSRGINRLTDLDGISSDQLISWPRVGKQSAAALLDALANLKKSNSQT